jgi:HPr kinase/phosphorylase
VDGGSELVHATAIAVGGRAAVIRGASGAGKSDLALRCIVLAPSPLAALPAVLVADDQVRLERAGGALLARAPDSIRGKLEVRGLGVVAVPCTPSATVSLIVDLAHPDTIERMPGLEMRTRLLGVELPLLRLAPFEPSAPAKLLVALATLAGQIPLVGSPG